MSAVQPLLPDVDFAYAELPDLHELIDRLRAHGPVVPVKYLGGTVWLINRPRVQLIKVSFFMLLFSLKTD